MVYEMIMPRSVVMKERKVGYSSQDRGKGIKTKKLDPDSF